MSEQRLRSVGETVPRAPGHLEPETQAWWLGVVADFVVEAHHQRLLTLAGEAWDRSSAARGMIEREGLTVDGRYGPRTHPAVAIKRDAELVFSRMLRQLDLDEPPVANAIGLRRRRK